MSFESKNIQVFIIVIVVVFSVIFSDYADFFGIFFYNSLLSAFFHVCPTTKKRL